MMLVKDIMTSDYGTLQVSSKLWDVVKLFRRTRLDAVPVVDGQNKVIGVMTKHCLYEALLAGGDLNQGIEKYYRKNVIGIEREQPFFKLQDKLREHLVSQAVVTDSEGKACGIVTKVDLIRTLESQAIQLANELSAILKNLKNGIVALNSEGKVSLINPSAEELLKCKSSELFARAPDGSLAKLNLARVLEDGGEQGWFKINVEDSVILAKCLPIKENDEIKGAIGILQDLTEYEHVAQELESVKKLHQTLETVLEMAYDGLLVFDEQGTITMANNALAEFFNIGSGKKLIGKNVRDYLPKIDLSRTFNSGMGDIGNIETIEGRKCVISHLPMIREGKVVGAVCKIMYQNLPHLMEVLKRMDIYEKQISFYKDELSRVAGSQIKIKDIVGSSPKMERVKLEAKMAAASCSTVLLLGESGTGKELFAKAIHNESGRSGPLVKTNCAAIPENLLESEFFGYADGAFTGAKKGGKPGKIELADGGTLFLDEIGDMSPNLQAKLLRFLQEREFERVGGNKTIKVNVRIIAATNKKLERMVEEGSFREDLYYRLNVVSIRIPPLRERKNDILDIINYLIKKLNKIIGSQVSGISPAALSMLKAHQWPGNIRELENVIERAINMNNKGMIDAFHLPDYLTNQQQLTSAFSNNKLDCQLNLEKNEHELLLKALSISNGNRSKAAKIMGISRSSLYDKLLKYDIGCKQ